MMLPAKSGLKWKAWLLDKSLTVAYATNLKC